MGILVLVVIPCIQRIVSVAVPCPLFQRCATILVLIVIPHIRTIGKITLLKIPVSVEFIVGAVIVYIALWKMLIRSESTVPPFL
jgi:hypothetical protein